MTQADRRKLLPLAAGPRWRASRWPCFLSAPSADRSLSARALLAAADALAVEVDWFFDGLDAPVTPCDPQIDRDILALAKAYTALPPRVRTEVRRLVVVMGHARGRKSGA